MTRKAIGTSFVIALWLGSSAAGWAQRLHPRLKKNEIGLKTFILLPPKVTITRDTVKGGEGMLKESEDIATAVRKLVREALTGKGFVVIEEEAVGLNDEARYALADLQGKYDQLYPQVQRKMKEVEKGRFTLGEEVTKLRPSKPVEALIFVRGSGEVKTAGKAFMGALAGGRAGSILYLSLGLIDAQTGAVLYFVERQVASSSVIGKKFHEDPHEVLKKPIDKALQKVPAPVPAATAK